MTGQKRTPKLDLADWDRLRVMLAVHRGGTLTAAAKVLGVDHTTVARRLAALERDFKSMLFERGSSGYLATPLGEEVIAAAEHVEGEITGLLRRVDGASTNLTGRVRLTTTPHIAASLVTPALKTLLREHPKLDIELISDDRTLDLSKREADIAIRLVRPDMPGLVTRQLGQLALAFYQSSSDSRSFGTQRFLFFEESSGSSTLQRHLTELVSGSTIALRSNASHVLLEAARAGLGATLLPCFIGDSDKTLQRLPAPRALPLLPLWITYHEDLRRSPRVREMVTFLDRLIVARRTSLVPPAFPYDPL